MLHRLTSFPYSKPVSASKASSSRASPHRTLQDLDAATFCFKDTGREMWEVFLWGWTLAAAGVDVCGLGCSVLTLSAESQGMETYVSFNNERLLWLWQCSCVGRGQCCLQGPIWPGLWVPLHPITGHPLPASMLTWWDWLLCSILIPAAVGLLLYLGCPSSRYWQDCLPQDHISAQLSPHPRGSPDCHYLLLSLAVLLAHFIFLFTVLIYLILNIIVMSSLPHFLTFCSQNAV